MDEPKPSTKTADDTPINQGSDESASVAPSLDSAGRDTTKSIELDIESLAGLDAADAPELADDLASRLRAELSDS